MASSCVKIFGERNTATNVLTRLVQTNSKSECLPGVETDLDARAWERAHAPWIIGKRMREWCFDRIFAGKNPLLSWKHCATIFDDVSAFRDVLVLITVRHPASWFISLFENPYQCLRPLPATLSEFLNFSWETNRRERLGRQFFTPMELYEAKMESYLSFTGTLTHLNIAHHFVRFEDIVRDQKDAFGAIAEDLLAPREDFRALIDSTKDKGLFKKAAERRARANNAAVPKDLEFYRRYYGEEEWRERLVGLETEINGRIDWQRLSRFGYEPL